MLSRNLLKIKESHPQLTELNSRLDEFNALTQRLSYICYLLRVDFFQNEPEEHLRQVKEFNELSKQCNQLIQSILDDDCKLPDGELTFDEINTLTNELVSGEFSYMDINGKPIKQEAN